MRYEFGNNPGKVNNYRRFWSVDPVKRPLVGFTTKTLFPMMEFSAFRKLKSDTFLTPDMIQPEDFLDDMEVPLREGEEIGDDLIRGVRPLGGMPWFSGFLGFELRILEESIRPAQKSLSYEEIDELELDFQAPWFKKYIEITQALVERSQGRYPISRGALRGPSDMGTFLRGHTQMVHDFYDEPQKSFAMLEKIGEFSVRVLEEQMKYIPRYHGGYFDAQYQLWAPEPMIRMQEDNVFLFSPKLYRKFLQPVDREMAKHYPCSFIHLHSTSMFLLDAFLEIEEIRAFEINIEPTTMPLKGMMKYYEMVQRAKRPLIIQGSVKPGELRIILDRLNPAGLYMYLIVKDFQEADRLKKIIQMS